ncbi:Beige/BEACH domain [Carpediemonas membranifera]|uniref:Beige/BEACH domain n=1 Tax=Carpediemonas membranifera TaxID=201153 RepID=A0A8J6B9I3_9EUKA|nr:Beige/BEACH domain [Carpediemonas membranifera]|eukprot:KAG9395582.1 Beige/BEACH domain [Carpediemonas membranifera]
MPAVEWDSLSYKDQKQYVTVLVRKLETQVVDDATLAAVNEVLREIRRLCLRSAAVQRLIWDVSCSQHLYMLMEMSIHAEYHLQVVTAVFQTLEALLHLNTHNIRLFSSDDYYIEKMTQIVTEILRQTNASMSPQKVDECTNAQLQVINGLFGLLVGVPDYQLVHPGEVTIVMSRVLTVITSVYHLLKPDHQLYIIDSFVYMCSNSESDLPNLAACGQEDLLKKVLGLLPPIIAECAPVLNSRTTPATEPVYLDQASVTNDPARYRPHLSGGIYSNMPPPSVSDYPSLPSTFSSRIDTPIGSETSPRMGSELLKGIQHQRPSTDGGGLPLLALRRMCHFITILASHSISIGNLKKLYALMQNRDNDLSRRTRTRSPAFGLLLRTLQAIQDTLGPSCYLSLDGIMSGLVVPAIAEWDHRAAGYSIAAWLRVEDFTDRKGMPNYKPRLYSFLSDLFDGHEAYFESNRLCVVTIQRDNKKKAKYTRHESAFSFIFDEDTWYHVAISFGPKTATLFLNGVERETIAHKSCLVSKRPYTRCRIATNAEGGTDGGHKLYRPNALYGQLGPMYLFSATIAQAQASALHALGPEYHYSLTPLDIASYSDGGLDDKMVAELHKLQSRIYLAYTAKFISQDSCIDTTPKSNEREYSWDASMLPGSYQVFTHRFTDTFQAAGGIDSLTPLFDQFNLRPSVTTDTLTRVGSNLSTPTTPAIMDNSVDDHELSDKVTERTIREATIVDPDMLLVFLSLIRSIFRLKSVQLDLASHPGVARIIYGLKRLSPHYLTIPVIDALIGFLDVFDEFKQEKLKVDWIEIVLFDFSMWMFAAVPSIQHVLSELTGLAGTGPHVDATRSALPPDLILDTLRLHMFYEPETLPDCLKGQANIVDPFTTLAPMVARPLRARDGSIIAVRPQVSHIFGLRAQLFNLLSVVLDRGDRVLDDRSLHLLLSYQVGSTDSNQRRDVVQFVYMLLMAQSHGGTCITPEAICRLMSSPLAPFLAQIETETTTEACIIQINIVSHLYAGAGDLCRQTVASETTIALMERMVNRLDFTAEIGQALTSGIVGGRSTHGCPPIVSPEVLEVTLRTLPRAPLPLRASVASNLVRLVNKHDNIRVFLGVPSLFTRLLDLLTGFAHGGPASEDAVDVLGSVCTVVRACLTPCLSDPTAWSSQFKGFIDALAERCRREPAISPAAVLRGIMPEMLDAFTNKLSCNPSLSATLVDNSRVLLAAACSAVLDFDPPVIGNSAKAPGLGADYLESGVVATNVACRALAHMVVTNVPSKDAPEPSADAADYVDRLFPSFASFGKDWRVIMIHLIILLLNVDPTHSRFRVEPALSVTAVAVVSSRIFFGLNSLIGLETPEKISALLCSPDTWSVVPLEAFQSTRRPAPIVSSKKLTELLMFGIGHAMVLWADRDDKWFRVDALADIIKELRGQRQFALAIAARTTLNLVRVNEKIQTLINNTAALLDDPDWADIMADSVTPRLEADTAVWTSSRAMVLSNYCHMAHGCPPVATTAKLDRAWSQAVVTMCEVDMARITSAIVHRENASRLALKECASRKKRQLGHGANFLVKLDKTEDAHRMRRKLVHGTKPRGYKVVKKQVRKDERNRPGSDPVVELTALRLGHLLNANGENVEIDTDVDLITEEEAAAAQQTDTVMSVQCDAVHALGTTHGRLDLGRGEVFFTMDRNSDDSADASETKDRHWALDTITAIHGRRYLFKHCGIEIFINDRTNFFFTFPTTKIRNHFIKRLQGLMPGRVPALTPAANILASSTATENWQKGLMSNFDYLMYLNTVSGRTYNDLNQYPVFPWVISDYTSPALDLSDPKVYRVLSRPVGAQTDAAVERLRARFEAFVDVGGSMPPFHYGTHYSSAGCVLNYLVRLEPFTRLAMKLQGGTLDHPDRIFSSIGAAWKNTQTDAGDVRELIPEFFYLPEFLGNPNNIDIGTTQTDEEIGTVKLPPWASTPDEFVRINRAALESPYVSEHLHEWIDLIFGFKQKGKAAVDACNVFFHLTYEGAVDIDAIKDDVVKQSIIAQITNFGQVPSQLFSKPHPARSTAVTSSPLVALSESPMYSQLPPEIHATHTEAKHTGQAEMNLATMARSDRVITVSEALGVTVHRMSTLQPEDERRRAIPSLLDPAIEIPAHRLFAARDRTLFAGGHWDSSFKLFNVETGRVVQSVTGHTDTVTGVAVTIDGTFALTASVDTTVDIWRIVNGVVQQPACRVLTRHDAPVRCLVISDEADLVVTCSVDGMCALHSISRGKFISSFNVTGLPVDAAIANQVAVLEADGTLSLFSICGKFLTSLIVEGAKVLVGCKSANCFVVATANRIAVLCSFTLRELLAWDVDVRADITCISVGGHGESVIAYGCVNGDIGKLELSVASLSVLK